MKTCNEYLLNPLGHLNEPFQPAVHPAMNQKSFHFELLEDQSALATWSHCRCNHIIVIRRNRTAARDAPEILHVITDGSAE